MAITDAMYTEVKEGLELEGRPMTARVKTLALCAKSGCAGSLDALARRTGERHYQFSSVCSACMETTDGHTIELPLQLPTPVELAEMRRNKAMHIHRT